MGLGERQQRATAQSAPAMEALLFSIVRRHLDDYVVDFDSNKFSMSIMRGRGVIRDIGPHARLPVTAAPRARLTGRYTDLKVDAVNELLQMPQFHIQRAHVDCLQIKVRLAIPRPSRSAPTPVPVTAHTGTVVHPRCLPCPGVAAWDRAAAHHAVLRQHRGRRVRA